MTPIASKAPYDPLMRTQPILDTNVAATAARTSGTNTLPSKRSSAHVSEGWRAREFFDDGITHVELRDSSDCIQVIIANTSDLFWAIPIGFPTARVSLPNWRLKLPEGAVPAYIYACSSYSLIRYCNGREVLWFVQPTRVPSTGQDLHAMM